MLLTLFPQLWGTYEPSDPTVWLNRPVFRQRFQPPPHRKFRPVAAAAAHQGNATFPGTGDVTAAPSAFATANATTAATSSLIAAPVATVAAVAIIDGQGAQSAAATRPSSGTGLAEARGTYHTAPADARTPTGAAMPRSNDAGLAIARSPTGVAVPRSNGSGIALSGMRRYSGTATDPTKPAAPDWEKYFRTTVFTPQRMSAVGNLLADPVVVH